MSIRSIAERILPRAPLAARSIAAPLVAGVMTMAAPIAAPAGAQQNAAAEGGGGRGNPLPLEQTRRLQFTTDEATWMSPDVSPDGRAIVFEILGDLYTVPVTGGKATRITSGPAYDTQPRYSPDGKSIVFVSDRSGADNVWVADADGRNARAVTRDERTFFVSPEWTPDGHFIVVSKSTEIVNRPRTYQLFMYDRNGTGGPGVQLTGLAGTAAPASVNEADPKPQIVLGAAFGADPRYLYVAASSGRGYGSWQIAKLDRATGRLYERTNEIASAMRPVLSPDGKYLVYGTRVDGTTALKLVELASGDERWLVKAVDRDDQEASFTRDLMPGASFTPDSRALVATYGGKIWRVSVPDGQATLIPFTADVDVGMGPLTKFDYATNDSVVTARRIEQPALSPNGRVLAFSALGHLYIQALMPLTGRTLGPAKRVTDSKDGEYFPAWSPDNQYLAYVSWNDLEGGYIWRVRADGTGSPERLVRQPAFYERLAYTPSGQRIVAARGPRQQRLFYFDELRTGRPSARELVWIPAAGGEATTITALNVGSGYASTHHGLPHFTADSTRVFYDDPVDGLVSVRWDGTDRRQLLKVTGWNWTRNPPSNADEILMSPTGAQAIALVNNQVWLMDVPPAGDHLPTIFVNAASNAIPLRRLTRVGADFLAWRPDGHAVEWAIGSSFFSLDVASADTALAPHRWDVAVTVPRDRPSGVIALRGARVITMRGGGTAGSDVIENADILVTNNRITAVGPRGSVRIPAGARSMDMGGKTILPGYVDIHAHMWAPWGVHRQQVWEYVANLAYGVTATRDPQTMEPDVLTYADRVAAGDIIGPRIFTTARGMFASEDLKSLDDARDLAHRYADFYKTETIKNYLIGDRKQRQLLVMAARENRLTPTAEGTQDFKMNLTLALDGFAGHEHVLSLSTIYKDVVQLYAQSGITYTPTLIVTGVGPAGENQYYSQFDVHDDPKLQRFLPHEELDRRTLRRTILDHPNQFVIKDLAAQAAKIVAAGGRVGLGAHGQLQGFGADWEIWNLASGGMKPHDVLRMATIVGAEAIGHGAELGSIEAGKFADLQVLDKNPLDNIKNTTSIRYVMINGRLYETDTMDEIWPERRALPHQWWQATVTEPKVLTKAGSNGAGPR